MSVNTKHAEKTAKFYDVVCRYVASSQSYAQFVHLHTQKYRKVRGQVKVLVSWQYQYRNEDSVYRTPTEINARARMV